MRIEWNKELYHYGMPRRSGRYKWGSGEDPYHHGASAPSRKVRKLVKRAETASERGDYKKAALAIGRAVGQQKRDQSAKGEIGTGVNYKKVNEEHSKKLRDADKKYGLTEADFEKMEESGEVPEKAERYMNEVWRIDAERDIKTYEAAVKDIGYHDVNKGAELYKKYQRELALTDIKNAKANYKSAKRNYNKSSSSYKSLANRHRIVENKRLQGKEAGTRYGNRIQKKLNDRYNKSVTDFDRVNAARNTYINTKNRRKKEN